MNLLALLAAFGVTLGGFTHAQLEPIRVEIVDGPVWSGTSKYDMTPQRAASIACYWGTFEGGSCPDLPGPWIQIDRGYLPVPADLTAPANAPWIAHFASHEARNLTTRGWDTDSYQFACD